MIAAEVTVLETLVRSHPRLLIDGSTAARLRAAVAADPFVAAMARDVCEAAEVLVREPAFAYPPPGHSVMWTSRPTLERVQTLGVAWLATGRPEYVDALRKNLLAVCAFPDWGRRDGFLDIAEMAAAVALGYDWLHAQWSDTERATMRSALARHALEPGLAAFAAKDWWVDTHINWNQVSHGGLVLAALAIADDEPRWAREVLPVAIANVPKALAAYDPDGNCGEGAGYWSYGVDYTAYLIGALESALGSDFGLAAHPGFGEVGQFPLHACGPTGLYANFADVVGDRNTDVIGNRGRRGNTPVLLWLAQRFARPEYARIEIAMIERGRARPMDLLWYRAPTAPAPAAPLAKRFRGEVPLACFRSAWDDERALYAWIKAGYNQINHGHLDLGSFGLDALGVRWAVDLGAERYSLPGYFEKKPGGRRWNHFRLNSEGHNVPLVDGRGQDASAVASMPAFADDARRSFAIVDYGSSYAPAATRARRGLMVLDRRAVLVQDEFALSAPCAFTWGMTTDAVIAPDGASAELRQGGQRLRATILAPAGARFAVASGERPPPERPNPGVRRLLVELPRAAGELTVAVLLAPVWPDGAAPAPTVAPLDAWGR